MAEFYEMVGGEKMSYIMMVIKGNLRKSKSVYISIFILMMIVSIALCSVLSYDTNSKKRDAELMKQVGFGDMLAALYSDQKLETLGVDADSIVRNIKKCDAVKEVRISDFYGSFLKNCNGKSGESSIFLLDNKDKNYHYTQYDEKGNPIHSELKQGEISVPFSYRGLYHCKIGDTVEIGSDDTRFSYKVASFFEDPFMGSSVMGIKTLLISSEDFQKLSDFSSKNQNEKDRAITKSKILNIFQNPDKKLTSIKFEKTLNDASSYASYCFITLSKQQSIKYTLLLTNLFSSFLMVFIILLLIAALIVLGHNISSSMQLDYKNIGILKSVGMDNSSIRKTFLIGYLGTVLLGLLAGIPLSVLAVRYFNESSVDSLGMYVSNQLNIKLTGVILLAILVLVAIFILIKTAKLSRITPLKAMNDGMDSVHFSSIMKLPVSSKILQSSLAYRQFISEKKQYLAAIVVAAILMIFMVMVNDIYKWVNSNNMVSDFFSITKSDVEITYHNDEIEKKVDKIIQKYGITEKYRMHSEYMLLDNAKMYCYIIDPPDAIISVKKGRTCKYDNEILITQYIGDELGVGVGDKIKVKKDGVERTMIVSGIYESTNDVGRNFAMSYEAYQKLAKGNTKKNHQWGNVDYVLKNQNDCGTLIKELREKYEDGKDYKIQSAVSEKRGDDFFGIITVGVESIAVLVYFLGAVFVLITVSIVCGKIIAREKKDFGVYKALGFTSGKLRMQLAIRFGVTALLGSLIGSILSFLVSPPAFRALFSTFGVYHYQHSVTILSTMITGAFMIVLFVICAYVKSRKVKKIGTRQLISE